MKLKEYQKNLKKEYQETFQNQKPQKKPFQFKLRYAVALAFSALFILLLGYHISILCYNASVDSFNESLRTEIVDYETTSKLSSIHSKKEYEDVVDKYKRERTYRTKKQSLLSMLFSIQLGGCSSKAGDTSLTPPTIVDEVNSFNTNIQVEGIDESDVAKCDGSYIYYLHSKELKIYSIETNSVVDTCPDFGSELYVVQNKIVSIGRGQTSIYEFTNNQIVLKNQFEYRDYLDSRVVKDNLYLVVGSDADDETILYDDCYYDSCSRPLWLYSLFRINLNTLERKEVQLLSNRYSILYASNQHFYIATKENIFTSISIFSYDLEPVGVVRVCGTILNQFSMDEYEDTFRVVSTDTARDATELNAISIFSVSEDFKRIGYLDQGIGLGRQTVRSVRFERNTCYVVTYETKDPLYEIDCSKPSEPQIVSIYQAPGYSNYLHTFNIEDKEYVLGLGFTDSRNPKISVYEKTDQTTQIGKDFILARNNYYDKGDYTNKYLYEDMFTNHKALWFYGKENKLYLGAMVAYNEYLIFEIDVNQPEKVISIYQRISMQGERDDYARLFLVNNFLYLVNNDTVKVVEFHQATAE